MTTPTAHPGFMTHLGQLEVRAEQEGLKLIHAAGNWVDHLTWTQVTHLLVPAIRAVAPGALGVVSAVAGAVADATTPAAADAAEESFEDWARRQLEKAALGLRELRELVEERTGDAVKGTDVPPADPPIPAEDGQDVPLPTA